MFLTDWIAIWTGRKLSAAKMRYAREGRKIPGKIMSKWYAMEGDRLVIVREGALNKGGVHSVTRTKLTYTPDGLLERFDDYYRCTSVAGTEIKDTTTVYDPPGSIQGTVTDRSSRSR